MTVVFTVLWSFLVKNAKFLKNAELELTRKLFVLVKLKATRIRLKLLNWTLCNILGSCSVVYVWQVIVWCKPIFQGRTALNLDFSISAQKNFLIKLASFFAQRFYFAKFYKLMDFKFEVFCGLTWDTFSWKKREVGNF